MLWAFSTLLEGFLEKGDEFNKKKELYSIISLH